MTDTKMIYLIKRRPTTSREELVAHWFANHMPAVIAAQHDAAARGKRHAKRYHVALFDADRNGEHPWDGMAQLWWENWLMGVKGGAGRRARRPSRWRRRRPTPSSRRSCLTCRGRPRST